MGLAPELREKIWIEALKHEAEGRVVFYDHTFGNHGPRIIPRKQLVSTMAGICRETRRFAQEFYSVQLKVYRMRPVDKLSFSGPKFLDGSTRRKLNREVWYAETTPEAEAGTVYLRPETDFLVKIGNGHDGFAPSFLRLHEWETEGYEGPFARFISARLATSELAAVRNLVVAEVSIRDNMRPDGLGDHPFWNERTSRSRFVADRYWRRSEFPNANRWLHCWVPDMGERVGFGVVPEWIWPFVGLLRDLGQHGGVERLDIREWRPSLIWEHSDLGDMCTDVVLDPARRIELCDRIHSLIDGDEAQRAKYRAQTQGYPTRLNQAQCEYCFRLNNAPHQPMGGPPGGDGVQVDDPKFYDEKAERFRVKVAQDIDGQYLQHLRTHYLSAHGLIYDHEALVEGEYK
ncbi:hypothetical protein PG985_009755 [Apiospora marii]|uniref:uncharacterized protein n=1 Tax=Apiospora marii TaxID=335849 RepID=UPI00312F3102